MRIVRVSQSKTQKISFITVKDLGDYLVIKIPEGMTFEVEDEHTIHVRKGKQVESEQWKRAP